MCKVRKNGNRCQVRLEFLFFVVVVGEIKGDGEEIDENIFE